MSKPKAKKPELTAADLLKWSNVSRALGYERTAVSKNRIPKAVETEVNGLLKGAQHWLDLANSKNEKL